MGYYKRPHCPSCNLIWGYDSIGKIINCTKCQQPLILKDFNPYKKLFIGLIVIALGSLTFLIKDFPIFWIGGFLWGLSIILYGFQNWQKIKKLDGNIRKVHKVNIIATVKNKIKIFIQNLKYRNFTVMTCKSCGQRIRFPNRKLTITCPKCKYNFSYVP